MGMPPGVAGLLLHRKALVPVIDLDVLISGQPCAPRLSTRILVARYRAGPEGARIGLRVDRATDTERVDEREFLDSGLTAAEPPSFGPLLRRGAQTIQLVNVDQLLSEAVRASLFSGAVNA